ncbi:hypothetical protein C427_4641 [Paraglaciecola psychrophila 170]|uniref:Uncharacterized protein n=1 Tax=Paraglaciecola psychrophila 170 TaxID=1129794 RepID=M4RSS0_9ALTE|nr:hypothetical protein C427_4641 [Paraglaciecola psychrophila 170]
MSRAPSMGHWVNLIFLAIKGYLVNFWLNELGGGLALV